MAIPHRTAQETVGDRFNALYARANEVLLFGGATELPAPDTLGPETQFSNSPLSHKSFLFAGKSGFSHLSTLVSLNYNGKRHRLFSVTGSARNPSDLSDFEPSRIAGFRGDEAEGDYALNRGWEQHSSGLVLGYLGRAGVRSADAASRSTGRIRAGTDTRIEDLSHQQESLLGIVTSGISINFDMAGEVLKGADPKTVLTVLGREFEPEEQAA